MRLKVNQIKYNTQAWLYEEQTMFREYVFCKGRYIYIMLSLRSRALWWKECELWRKKEWDSNLAFTTDYLCDSRHIN